MNDVTKVEELEEECSELETLEGSENYIRNCNAVFGNPNTSSLNKRKASCSLVNAV